MGKGYGRYWLIAIGVGLPVIAFGVWRLIDRSQGLSYDEATQFWIRTAGTVAILLAATLVLWAAIALPYIFGSSSSSNGASARESLSGSAIEPLGESSR